MSTQTGIRPDDRLSAFFGHCRSGRHRLIKVRIRDEAMVLDQAQEAIGTWKQDWDRMVPGAVEEAEPCYLLYRYCTSTLLINAFPITSIIFVFLIVSAISWSISITYYITTRIYVYKYAYSLLIG